MTWITDGSGTRWVEVPQKKRRAAGRALRFGELKVGDQIMRRPQEGWYRKVPTYYVVTDLWFDPVEGQHDDLKGRMVGYALIGDDGEILGRKNATTLRGLASQQFHYADMDYVQHCKTRAAQMDEGKVIGIGRGEAIRRRPKVSGL